MQVVSKILLVKLDNELHEYSLSLESTHFFFFLKIGEEKKKMGDKLFTVFIWLKI
jgi:hypothetical protein